MSLPSALVYRREVEELEQLAWGLVNGGLVNGQDFFATSDIAKLTLKIVHNERQILFLGWTSWASTADLRMLVRRRNPNLTIFSFDGNICTTDVPGDGGSASHRVAEEDGLILSGLASAVKRIIKFQQQ